VNNERLPASRGFLLAGATLISRRGSPGRVIVFVQFGAHSIVAAGRGDAPGGEVLGQLRGEQARRGPSQAHHSALPFW
jgi:hypothetical protein